jgi:hypothetical protein
MDSTMEWMAPIATGGALPRQAAGQLRELRNVGKAALQDLEVLGVRTVAQLAQQSPDRLFERLQTITGRKQDPCVWDVFAAAICQARTGVALPWWEFTLARKEREARAAGKGMRT